MGASGAAGAARITAGNMAANLGAWGAGAVASLGYVAISSRVYLPATIGDYAVGLMAETVVYLAIGSGLAVAVQRLPELDRATGESYVGRALISGLLAAIVMVAGAGTWASLWGAPGAATFTIAFAAVALLHPLGQVVLGMLRSSGRHRTAARATAAAVIGAAIVGVVPVVITRSPIALVASNVLVQVFTLLAAMIAGIRLVPAFSRSLAEGRFVFASVLLNVANYVTYNGLAWSVSRFIAVATLGLYTRAWLLADLPAQGMATAATQALFPTFAQRSRERTHDVATDSLASVTALTTVALGLIAALSSLLVTLILGDRWREAIPMLAVLACVLAAMPPQWILASQLQGQARFASLRSSRLAGLAVAAGFALLVAFTGEVLVAAVGAGVTHLAIHCVDLRTAASLDLLDARTVLAGYARSVLACIPLWLLAVVQAIGAWQPADLLGLAALAILALLAGAASLLLALRGRPGQVLARNGLLPARLSSGLDRRAST